jgi:hypothetical protein
MRRVAEANRLEPRSIALGIRGVNEIGLAKTSAASILQRLLGSSSTRRGHRRSRAIAVVDRRDATLHWSVAAHRCLPRKRRKREA